MVQTSKEQIAANEASLAAGIAHHNRGVREQNEKHRAALAAMSTEQVERRLASIDCELSRLEYAGWGVNAADEHRRLNAERAMLFAALPRMEAAE